MNIIELDDVWKVYKMGKMYFFYSLKCKEEFEKNPSNYLGVKSNMKMPE